MAVGIATSTETTMKVHGKLALENGATIDGIFEVIRILFFTCGDQAAPALETLEIFSKQSTWTKIKHNCHYVKTK